LDTHDSHPVLERESLDRELGIGCGSPSSEEVSRAVWGFVALGVALRVTYYSLNFPLWWDEAFVAVNLLRRGYFDLVRPLDYGQVCPLLFLWTELTAVRWLGFSEWSLRLFPLVCSAMSVVLFRWMAGQVLGGRALLLAVAIFAVSTHPIKHAADVKPYASDALFSVALLIPAFAWSKANRRAGPLWALATITPIALLSSHPSIFLAGGIGLALAWPAWRSGDWSVRTAFLTYGLVNVATYVGIYAAFTREQASAASPGMAMMWQKSFPPLDSIVGLVRWLAVVHTGEMLSYPCGGEGGASSLSLGLCVVGAVALWRRRRRVALGCLLAPLGVAMIAAAVKRYPYGGPAPHGSSARVMQYAAPGLCLLIGLGASKILERVRDLRLRRRLLRLSMVGLVVVGIVPIVASLGHPYRAYQAEAARRFARDFWPGVGRGAEVACLRWDLDVAEWDSVRLGVAVMLCDQAIYSPSRRAGGPDWDAISRDRPLRCVIGEVGGSDGPRVEAWLNRMNRRFDLRRRETREMNAAEPGRRPVIEKFEILEFVPKEVAPPVRPK
jgi:hypothetical protein